MSKNYFLSILCGLFLLTATQTQAQGVSWQNAALLTSGQSDTAAINTSGVEHWYKITLTGNSAAEFTVQTDSVLSIYYLTLYAANGDTIGISARNQLYIRSYYGKFNVNDLAAGTYYLKVSRDGGYGTYSLSYKATPPALPDDAEPNDIFSQAIPISNNQTKTGHLGFWNLVYSGANADIDNYDWYKITLTERAAGEFTIQTDSVLSIYYLTLYADIDGTIGTSARNELYIRSYYGKFKINDLAAGTYYLRVSRDAHYGTYSLQYKETPPSLPEDAEPNDEWYQAVELLDGDIVSGQLGYNHAGTTDIDNLDWYTFTIGGNAAAEFIIQTDSVLSIYYLTLYAANGDTIGTSFRNELYIRSYYSKFNVNDLAAGTYYLRVLRDANYGTYTLSYKATPPALPDDPEPNDLWNQAVELTNNSVVTGHLGFWNLVYSGANADIDNYDWYKITLAENNAAEFIIQTDSVLTVYYLTLYAANGDTIGTSFRNELYLRSYYGKFNVNDLAAGTYYLRVSRDANYGTYTLSYKATPPALPDDPEPNNFWHQAVEINDKDTVTGHLGFWHLVYSGANADIDNEDWYKFTLPDHSGVDFTIQTDSVLTIYYLDIYATNGDTVSTSKTASQYLRTYYGQLNVQKLDSGTYYLRVLRDGYYGAYTMNLNVTPGPQAEFSYIQNLNTISFVNESLYADSLTWNFGDGTANYVNHRNPNHIYSEPGYYPVRLIAFNTVCPDTMIHYVTVRGIQRVESNRGGNGGKVTISVIGGGMKENSQVKLRLGTEEIAAVETYTPNPGIIEATFNLTDATLGLYDVVVQNQDEAEMSLAGAFTVEEAIQPKVWVDIQGAWGVIRGRSATYTAMYGNTGNIDAQNRIIWIVTPDDPAEVTFIDADFYVPEFYPDEVWQLIQENDVKPYLKSTDMDSTAAPARYYGICVPVIPANSERSFTFKVLCTEDFRIQVFHTYGYWEDELADESNGTRSAGSLRAGDFNDCMVSEIGDFLKNEAIDYISIVVPFASCISDVYSFANGDYPKGNGWRSVFFQTVKTAWSCGSEFIPGSTIIKVAKKMVGTGFNAVQARNSLTEKCDPLKRRDGKDQDIAVRNSFDPNEKQGPSGYGEANCIAQRVFPYTILFENKNTATAAAQEVVITDTLDAQKFDLSTFRFKEFGYGENRYTVFQDDNKFVNNIDLRPGKNAILRVTGVLEDSVVTWRFLTLDPRTMDLTEDIDVGFLPPNVTSPEGEGFVSFVVSLKETVGNGAVINNFADIVFDVNEPIRTNIFSNKTDEIAPVSQVVSANYLPDTHEIEVTFSGTDPGGAGIKSYDLYVSTNGSEFVRAVKNISGNTFGYPPSGEGTYSFYSIATDSLSYRENAKSAGEASLEYTGIKTVKIDALQIYPNPVKEELFIKSELPVKKIELLDLTGRTVETCHAASLPNSATTINLSALPQGVYMLKIYTDSGVAVTKVVKE